MLVREENETHRAILSQGARLFAGNRDIEPLWPEFDYTHPIMDERILLQFENDGKPMKVVSFNAAEGIAFHKPKDASPLNVAIGLQALLPGRLDAVRLRNDWREKQFNLDVTVKDGGLLLSGFRGDPEGLPFGAYDLTVEVESYRFKNSQQRIVLKKGAQRDVIIIAEADRRRVELLDNFDTATEALVRTSSIDGDTLEAWLTSATPREARKACLLNILTKLAAPPMPGISKRSLTSRCVSLHFADVDRVYGSADPALRADLDEFVRKEGWVFEGRPKASIHQKVVRDAMKRFPELKGRSQDDFALTSYRQGGRNCLQIVVAEPQFAHPVLYVDVDIDLGNPLWDLQGALIHLGELLDSGRTDHFALHDNLATAATKDFVFYRVV